MPIFNTYRERAMVEMHTIADLALHDNDIVKLGMEVRLYIGPHGTELANYMSHRVLCLTQIANNGNISTADIERLCLNLTGSIPSPFDFGKLSTGM